MLLHVDMCNKNIVRNMSDSSKYRILARRSGVAGTVLCFSWAIIAIGHFTDADGVFSSYSFRFSQCLIAVLPIPAIITGLWSLRGLRKSEMGNKEKGHAIFGTVTGILSILAIFLYLKFFSEGLA